MREKLNKIICYIFGHKFGNVNRVYGRCIDYDYFDDIAICERCNLKKIMYEKIK